MKWLVITGGVVLVLGIALRPASRSLDQSANLKSPAVSSETAQRKFKSPTPALTNPLHASPQLPAAVSQIPRALLAAMEIEIDSDHRNELLDHAVESIPVDQLPVVLDSLKELDSPPAAEARERLIRRWAETETPAAAAWATQLPEGPARRAALEQIAAAWSETELAGVVAWIDTLPAGASRQAATLATAYEAARTDPLTALDISHSLEPSAERDELLVHALSQWAGSDFANATGWAGKVSDPKLQARLLIAAATAAAELDPVTAATLIATDLDGGETQDRAVVALVQRWAQAAPQDAGAWVLQFPESPARDAAAQYLVAQWTAQDAAAAGQWLGELPEGTLRTVGLRAHHLALALPGMPALLE